jgi:hypothetical protein
MAGRKGYVERSMTPGEKDSISELFLSIFGEHMWEKATDLVQKSHQSFLILAKEDPRFNVFNHTRNSNQHGEKRGNI